MRIPRLALFVILCVPAWAQWSDLFNTKLNSGSTTFPYGCPPDHFGFSTSSGWIGGTAPSLPFTATVPTALGTNITVTQMDYAFASYCYNIMANSGGAATDTKRNRLVIHGGGHPGATGSSGNEVYVLDMNASPPTMSRVTNPSIFDAFQTYQSNAGPFTDLACDASNPNIVRSASLSFTSAHNFADFHIDGAGTGFTIGIYQILTTTGGAAVLDKPACSLGATGGSYFLSPQEKYPSDGGPMVIHTYGSFVYLPVQDKFFRWEGGSPLGTDARHTWLLDAQNYTWQDATQLPGYFQGYDVTSCNATGSATPCSPSVSGAYCAWDPNRQQVICEWGSNGMLVAYDPAKNQWLPPLTAFNTFCSGVANCASGSALYPVIDPDLKLMLFFGNSNQVNPAAGSLLVIAVDLSPGSNFASQDWSSTVRGCGGTFFATGNQQTQPVDPNTKLNVNYPGLAYDPSINKIVGYPWDGNQITIFDPITRQCTSQTLPGPAVPYSQYTTTNGPFGRWAYFPNLGKYVIANRVFNDAFQFVLNHDAVIGMGKSTPVLIDRDGDGYGVGDLQVGPFTDLADVSSSWSISAITFAGGTATATTSSANTLVSKNYVAISGASPAGYNGTFQITVVDSTHFTYAISNPGGTASSGTVRNFAVSSASYTFRTPLTNVSGNIDDSQDLARYINITAGTNWNVSTVQIQSVVSGVAFLNASPTSVLGATAGSWIIPGSLGPDADDLDATVHSASDIITKYGTLTAFLNHIGYAPTRIWYLAPASASPPGNDATCSSGGAPIDSAHPCLTWTSSAISANITTGDMVLMRDGWNGNGVTMSLPLVTSAHSGTSGNPIVVMAYPGEQPSLSGVGNGFTVSDTSWFVVDGLRFAHSAGIGGGTLGGDFNYSTCDAGTPSNFHNVIWRNLLGVGGGGGNGLAPFSAFNGLRFFAMDHSMGHDDSSQHNWYIGSNQLCSDRVLFRGNIGYNANLNNFHLNGRMGNTLMADNFSYNSAISGISLQEGIFNSVFRNNVLWAPGSSAIDQSDYPGKTGLAICGATQNQTCTCPASTGFPGPIQQFGICPFPQTGNLFLNNTVYQMGQNNCINATCTATLATPNSPAYDNFNSSDSASLDLGHNSFRNNLFVVFGNNNAGAHIRFSSASFSDNHCNATCQSWLSTDFFDNNGFWQADGRGGQNIIDVRGVNTFTCLTAGTVTHSSGCLNSDPKFVNGNAASLDGTPTLVNLKLLPGSPAIGAGASGAGLYFPNPYPTPPLQPTHDAIGLAYSVATPAIGAYSQSGSACTITNSPSLPPWTINAAGYSVQMVSQNCGTGTLTWSITAGVPPSGITIDGGTGILAGTPTSVGTFSFTVQITDGGSNTATKVFSLTINAVPTISTASPLPGGLVNVAYSATIQGANGTAPYAWSIQTGTGALCSGLNLNAATGAISGTPTQGQTCNFTVILTDAAGATATKAFALTITPGCTLPVITTASPLPSGTIGTAYSQTLACNNGPCTWTATGLPAGLSVNSSSGAITGTPTASGTFSLGVTATSSCGTQVGAPSTFLLTIAAATTGNNGTIISGTVVTGTPSTTGH